MKLGIISSSGGSAFFAAIDCLNRAQISVQPTVIVDRPCGMMDGCQSRNIPCKLVAHENKLDFSQKCAEIFNQQNCQGTLLFYTRLVDPKPFHNASLKLNNIHPSLLPAFPGFNAAAKALRYGCGIIGSSLHDVDEGVDTGRLIAQVASGIPVNCSLSSVESISYVQKVYLTLVFVELLSGLDPVQAPFKPFGKTIQAGNVGLAVKGLQLAFEEFNDQIEANRQ